MKKILILLLLIFVVIQFIRPAKNIHEVDQSKNVASVFQTPISVKNSLEVSCYDFHINNTVYP